MGLNDGQDLLASALQEQMPGVFETWMTWHPVTDRIIKKKQKARLKGPYRDFIVSTGAPGDVEQVLDGGQTLQPATRTESGHRANEYPARQLYRFYVPAAELDRVSGPNDLAQILKKYPEAGMVDLYERFARQFVMGDGLNLGGVFTLNSDTTYSPDGTARDGALEFAAVASQTKTVHGLAAATVTGWQNQYDHISSMANDGLTTLRKTLGKANRQGMAFGKCDLGLADPDTFYNYLNELTDPVRLTLSESKKGVGDVAPDQGRDGVKLLDCDLFVEDFIERADFVTANAQLGVVYLLNTSFLEAFVVGPDGEEGGVKTGKLQDFRMRGPFRHPDKDGFITEILWDGNFHLTSRRHHAVVTGGAQA